MSKQSRFEIEELIKIRRTLHSYPEIGFKEYQTQEYIISYFTNFNCQIVPCQTGIFIYFDNQKKETIAYRCEEDALLINEENNREYKSINEGLMHACGHDGHMAILCVLGRYINQHLSEINYNVMLIFQPAEELSGGSLMMMSSSFYQNHIPKYVYGLHVYPSLEFGKIYSNKGPFLAKCTEIDIMVKGKSSHATKQKEGLDAIKIMHDLLSSIYQYLDNFKAHDFIYLIGKIQGGTLRNIVADHCLINMTLRNLSIEQFLIQKKSLIEICEQIKKKYQTDIEIVFNEGTESVYNDEDLFEKVNSIYPLRQIETQMIGDDFANYRKYSQILYVLLGIDSSPLHSSTFNFDEEVLKQGLDFFKKTLLI